MKKTSKIYVAEHTGLIGSAIVRKLKEEKYKNILIFTSEELDLKNKDDTETMFRLEKPEYVFLAAARSGGIYDNNIKPGEYLYNNITIQTNVIEAARKYGTKKLIFLSSSNVYPKISEQPIKEEYLMTSSIDPANISYAIAKIAGIEMCRSYRKQYGSNFISVISSNVYGPNDNFDIPSSRVIPSFIRKFHEAKIQGITTVEILGDGTPLREFLYVDDLVDALITIMHKYNLPQPINVGSGYDVPIKFLAKMIADIIEYKGELFYNKEYTNGPQKILMDSSKIRELGWEPYTSLEEGIKNTYNWFVENYEKIRG